jgi:glycosyltransferase involved in cell wall biosynthesis
MSTRKYSNIGVVTFPLGKAGIPPVSNLLDILRALSQDLYVITGNAGSALVGKYGKVNFDLVNHKTGTNVFSRVVKFIYTQLRISFKVARLSRKVDLWLFTLGDTSLLLPLLAAKAAGNRVAICLSGSDIQASRAIADPLRVPFLVALISRIDMALCNRIVLYSKTLIPQWGLHKYKHKISIAHQYFLDSDKFKIEKPLSKRGNTVGYIGRLSQEKGIMNFVAAIPGMCELKTDIRILIGGDGQLRSQVEEQINGSIYNSKVELLGWIPDDKFPSYLNELKLLVIPSYTEAGPYILFEAMACGTPVLATPVGAIPDVIRDGKTGFIMTDNSPENIASNVIRALNNAHIDHISQNALALVETTFTYEAAVEGYRSLLNEFFKRQSV